MSCVITGNLSPFSSLLFYNSVSLTGASLGTGRNWGRSYCSFLLSFHGGWICLCTQSRPTMTIVHSVLNKEGRWNGKKKKKSSKMATWLMKCSVSWRAGRRASGRATQEKKKTGSLEWFTLSVWRNNSHLRDPNKMWTGKHHWRERMRSGPIQSELR